MNNEEFLRLFDELVNDFDNYSPNEVKRRMADLRDYARNNLKDDAIATDLERASDVVYGSVQANPNEPKEIVLSSRQNLNDRFIAANDEANYYRNLDRKVVSEYLNKQKEASNIDRSMYIPGTNILKPEDRKPEQTDAEYEEYLRNYYAKHFPNVEAQVVSIGGTDEKSLATLDDVKKSKEIEDLENAIKNKENKDMPLKEELDFFGEEALEFEGAIDADESTNNKEESLDNNSASISKERSNYDVENEEEQLDENEEYIDINNYKNESKTEPEEVVLDSYEGEKRDPEEEVLDPYEESEKHIDEVLLDPSEEDLDYTKDKGKKTKKIGKIRKAFRKIKEILKEHKNKIAVIAGVLVGAVGIGSVIGFSTNTNDKKEDLSENKDNSKSNIYEYDATMPSATVADSYRVSTEEVLNEINKNENEVEDTNQSDIVVDDSADYESSDDTLDVDVNSFEIGDAVKFDGDYIYKTSKDAYNETNKLTPAYSKNDDREISAIRLISPDGTEARTVTTKGEAKQLEDMGWKVESVNIKNNTRSNDTYVLTYEGWANLNDISKHEDNGVKVK